MLFFNASIAIQQYFGISWEISGDSEHWVEYTSVLSYCMYPNDYKAILK